MPAECPKLGRGVGYCTPDFCLANLAGMIRQNYILSHPTPPPPPPRPVHTRAYFDCAACPCSGVFELDCSFGLEEIVLEFFQVLEVGEFSRDKPEFPVVNEWLTPKGFKIVFEGVIKFLYHCLTCKRQSINIHGL